MEERQLRETLQHSVRNELYVRPPDPDFSHAHSAELALIAPARPSIAPNDRPTWILDLQPFFDQHHTVEDIEPGAVLYVQVWYLNPHPDFHCGLSRSAKLSSDSFMWRTELMSPWLERLIRASSADFFVIQEVFRESEDSADEPSGVHVIFVQGLEPDSRAVLVSVRGSGGFRVPRRRFAHNFQSQVAVNDLLRLAVPDDFALGAAMVQTKGYTYLRGDHVSLQHGDHLVARISNPAVDLNSDDMSLQQVFISPPRVQCKPAEFTHPDDLAFSLPQPDLPPRSRPYHDGEFEWSLELGTQMRSHGDYDAWNNAVSMNVDT